MDKKKIEKLVSALTTQRVLLMAHQVLLLRLGVSQQEYADAIQGCIQHANPYRSKILGNLDIPQKIYIHINNTNPILLETSKERKLVDDAGIGIGYDGMEILI